MTESMQGQLRLVYMSDELYSSRGSAGELLLSRRSGCEKTVLPARLPFHAH